MSAEKNVKTLLENWKKALKYNLLQIYRGVCRRKNFENRLIFGQVMVKSLVLVFLTHGVDAFCGIPDTHKSISIRALPRTPHGELTALAS